MQLDAASGNTKWKAAINTELAQIIEYPTLRIKGKERKAQRTINLFDAIFFDVKHDGQHKARYVAGGNLTDPPLDSIYSGVVSLRSLRLMIFLPELSCL